MSALFYDSTLSSTINDMMKFDSIIIVVVFNRIFDFTLVEAFAGRRVDAASDGFESFGLLLLSLGGGQSIQAYRLLATTIDHRLHFDGVNTSNEKVKQGPAQTFLQKN